MAIRRLLILPAVILAITATVAGADPALQLRQYESRHFTVRFEGREDPALVWALLERLESAYRDVGRQLGAFPGSRVPVMLYTDGKFPVHASVPHWAQGLFDGQIRLAVSWAALHEESLDKTLRHEYTHALIHARTRGNVPTWLSEGLAVANEGRGADHERNLARAADRLIPLDELHGSFLNLPSTQVPLAYAESAAAVDYLLSRHGAPKVRALLERLGESKNFDAAFQEAVGVPYADFRAAWMRRVIDYPGAGG
ncbi:MAG: peptidase MA family metallohydrolase [Nitrospirales bacterium]|nr:peptidase MA family metallohydrolase [Nitrospirales bacterium]